MKSLYDLPWIKEYMDERGILVVSTDLILADIIMKLIEVLKNEAIHNTL